MKILIDIGHPAHVHYFKNFIRIMQFKGHEVIVSARNKDIALELLSNANISFLNRGEGRKTLLGRFFYLIKADILLFNLAREVKPDICLSFGSPYLAHASKLLGIPHIAFADTEHNTLKHKITNPFSDVVLTPSAYRTAGFEKQIKFDGYMELCYLHPNRFSPNREVLKKIDLHPDEKYSVLRFVSWEAIHDKNHRGFSKEQKIKVVKELEKYGRVFVSSESELPAELRQYKFELPVHEMHDFLAFADLMYGESATMASESAVLGVPAIFHDDTGRGYTDEQEKKYNLVYNFSGSQDDQHKSLQKAIAIFSVDSKNHYQEKRQSMLNEKIDVTALMVWFVENYPDSKRKLQEEPDYQYNFK